MLTGPIAASRRRGGGGVITGFSGALAYRSADVTIDSNPAAVTYDTETYDTHDYLDIAGAPTLLQVPSSGLYRAIGNIAHNSSPNTPQFSLRVNAATVQGSGGLLASNPTDQGNIVSAILSLAAGDDIDLYQGVGATSITYGYSVNTQSTWLAVEKIDSATAYARLSRTSNIGLSAGVLTAIPWQTENVDVGGWADIASQATRLTVPPGKSLVRVSAGFLTGSFNAGGRLTILKNGSDLVVGCPFKSRDSTSAGKRVSLLSAPLEVSPGDYFEAAAQFGVAGSLNADALTWFQVEEVPSTSKRALVKHSTGASIGTSFAAVGWNAEEYDTDAIHDPVANNSRLTVPAGVARARVSFALSGSSSPLIALVRKNGAVAAGMPRDQANARNYREVAGASPWVNVTPGDYFEVFAAAGSAGTLNAGSWFCLECE